MTQENLFDAASHARANDPATSHAAAERVDFAASHCRKILAALEKHGPMGKTRIAAACGLDGVAVARRLADLQRDGLAHPINGATEKSGTGREERIWRSV
jgi:predicted ArsR family transcriptional regulator